jgi:hypothetical protein
VPLFILFINYYFCEKMRHREIILWRPPYVEQIYTPRSSDTCRLDYPFTLDDKGIIKLYKLIFLI